MGEGRLRGAVSRICFAAQAGEEGLELRPQSPELAPVGAGKSAQHIGAVLCQYDTDLPPVDEGLFAPDEVLCFHAVDELNSTMVLYLESFCQLADGDGGVTGITLDGE